MFRPVGMECVRHRNPGGRGLSGLPELRAGIRQIKVKAAKGIAHPLPLFCDTARSCFKQESSQTTLYLMIRKKILAVTLKERVFFIRIPANDYSFTTPKTTGLCRFTGHNWRKQDNKKSGRGISDRICVCAVEPFANINATHWAQGWRVLIHPDKHAIAP